jgi:hypothetical protein
MLLQIRRKVTGGNRQPQGERYWLGTGKSCYWQE